MVSNAPVANGIALLPELTPEQELDARFRLLQALQTSLQPEGLLQIFFNHLQPLLAISGLRYSGTEIHPAIKLGREGVHHCDYRLSLEEEPLGNIIFSRSKRFAERELAAIERWLSFLVHPLRNALHYQGALRLSMLDPLTRIGNRTAMDIALNRELQIAERYRQDLSLLLIDVDHFKRINDQFGHTRGDQVLKEVTGIIQQSSRGSDLTFRYGGEEFVVILGKTNTRGAHIIAERIRERVASTQLEHNGHSFQSTVSIGIASHLRDKKDSVQDLFERADKALYCAKRDGRNRVILQG
ncbi:abfX GGDEF domain protein [Cellvibrio japonicus Ueda107]|uniref:diguanylate cyclase n=2 Tax=Cellvibrio japonicus TaxID=155077 RepID=B3PFT6_CELJU|nr:abfX GGDEF domain protein [Cellvibrio japonicus Ueda107]QEI14154.1 GGDEF domain-containing protein [Cellvibrio japonicus]QEI17731.1 GGDEF domain-containing protein [Cellvibrio japonicus]QEI21306.1 GGDEF domain-containing protein [Cellvibrio japonicus]